MIYALFPGGFKPPHLGHLKVVEAILKKKPDLLYIIISKKPRLLIPPYKKIYQVSQNELREISQHYHKTYTKKTLEKDALVGKIPAITALDSYEIWKLYLQTLPEKSRQKIKLYISPFDSPIIFALTVISKKVKKNDTLILTKSEKNGENQRFSVFDKLADQGVKLVYQNVPKYNDLDSTLARQYLVENRKNKFYKFLPKNLKPKEKKEIWDLLHKQKGFV